MPIDKPTVVVASHCEAILYGLFLITCWFSARTLFFRDTNHGMKLVRFHEIRWLLTAVSTMLFIVCSLDVIVGIVFSALMTAEDPIMKFDTPSDWMNVIRLVDLVIIILLSDFVLIYGCWVVYGRRWLVIAPSVILYLGIVSVAIKATEVEVTSRSYESFRSAYRPWSITIFGVHAVQNILASGLLVWGIWRVGRQIDNNTVYPGGRRESAPRPLQRYVQVIVESGAVYTAIVIATFLASASRSTGVYLAVNTSLQTAGIVFNVIIVRSIERNLYTGVADSQGGPILPMFSVG